MLVYIGGDFVRGDFLLQHFPGDSVRGRFCPGEIMSRGILSWIHAGNGSSSPDAAVIWQVALASSLHIPPTAVVGRLPVVEGDTFPPDNDNLTRRSVKLTAVYTSI